MLHDLADIATVWIEGDREVVLVRAVETWGFGSRHDREVLLVNDDGGLIGRLGGERAAGRVRDELGAGMLGHDPAGAVEVVAEVTAVEATGEGLTCGGRVRALAQRIDHAPRLLWEALADGRPVVLVTTATPTSGAPPWMVVTADASATTPAADLPEDLLVGVGREWLAKGSRVRRVVEVGGTEVLLEVFTSDPRLLVVGGGEVAVAVTDQAALLGWSVEVDTDRDGALAALALLGPGDALVVLSHDPSIDTPVLAEALAGPVGYVGALGSRPTQSARRQRLADAGVADQLIDTIHGPVGLDLGATSPAETALSIVAEIVARRSGRSARPLGDHEGPIHLSVS